MISGSGSHGTRRWDTASPTWMNEWPDNYIVQIIPIIKKKIVLKQSCVYNGYSCSEKETVSRLKQDPET